MPAARRCIECVPGSKRNAPYPGPRCYTHHKAKNNGSKAKRKAQYVWDNYGITEGQYQQIYRFQGGVCAICGRVKGTGRKRLSVDHDHALAKLHDHPEDKGCPKCNRGELCQRCNVYLGHIRDDPAAFQRGIDYLLNPPARQVLDIQHE